MIDNDWITMSSCNRSSNETKMEKFPHLCDMNETTHLRRTQYASIIIIIFHMYRLCLVPYTDTICAE